MKIWRKCEKASLEGYFLTKWFRTDFSLWSFDYICSEGHRHLPKAPYGHKKHGPSLILIFPSQKQTSVDSEEGRNTTRPDTDIPDFLTGKWKTGSCVCFFDNFFFLLLFWKKYTKKSQEEPTWKCEVNIPVKVQRLHSLKETHSSYHHARRMRCRKILETVKNHLMKPLPQF